MLGGGRSVAAGANYHNALSHLRGGAQLICVLKADAYGLGAKAVAQLRQEGQRLFAVASYNERHSFPAACPTPSALILGCAGSAAEEGDLKAPAADGVHRKVR